MEPGTTERKGAKRKFVVEDDGAAKNKKVYTFKILLPIGVAVGLAVENPKPEMALRELVDKVREEYERLRKRMRSSSQVKRQIDWNSRDLHFRDEDDNKIRGKMKFSSLKSHSFLRLFDGSSKVAVTYENMWDLTPDTELLREVPEEYSCEAALADLIDNSLQAVWANGIGERRLISVDIKVDKISIFDTGPGMDGSDGNSIVKWGKMGASLNRLSKAEAIGGKPPYLMPFFGMFGYGGPIASMCLGKHAIVSSKTKESRKVYVLHLERDALLSNSVSELTWRTSGSMRDPSEEEIGMSSQGSFTKVEILEPKMRTLDICQLCCKLKDIYFPYIQCDELSKTGKTSIPVEFQVNGFNLAELEGGEVSITNLHSSNGEAFVFQLHLLAEPVGATITPGIKASLEANARLKCVYFPISKGKENIERILEELEDKTYGVVENYNSFKRVSVRRLGRLLPQACWASLPFMEFKQRKGDKAQLLKRCCLRVKCFVDTDSGFSPNPSKTDLAHHSPFTIALRSFGNKILEKEKEVKVEIFHDRKLLTLLQLEEEYQRWIVKMHDLYDEEIDAGEDDAVIVVSPKNKKALCISSDVLRVHRSLKRKGALWKQGQKIKILKGACSLFPKSNGYATLEYFVMEGFQGEAGGEARIICRPQNVADIDGSVLTENDGNPSLDIRCSLSLPISVIDSGKCQAMSCSEWDYQLGKQRQKAASWIDLLSAEHCEELDIDGALPIDFRVKAGQVPPGEVVAVVRPASPNASSESKSLDQKYILKKKLDMSMEVKYRSKPKDSEHERHLYSVQKTSAFRKGIGGLYIFPLGSRLPELFKIAGIYTFSFSLIDPNCKTCEKSVVVEASPEVGKWKLLRDEENQSNTVSLDSPFPAISIACFDIYDNRAPFISIPEVVVKLKSSKRLLSQVDKLKTSLSSDKSVFKIQDVLIECDQLDSIRPGYNATLQICTKDKLFSLAIPCQVSPGSLHHVTVQPAIMEQRMLPGIVVQELLLKMFDAYGNGVMEGSEVYVNVDGFHVLDKINSKRKVDDNGCIDLSGLLKVTAGFGKTGSISVLSHQKEVFKQEFQIEKRELRIASEIPETCIAGSLLEDIVFEVVNAEGEVDGNIHDEEKFDLPHTLTIKYSFNREDCTRYTFRHGRCTIPSIQIPAIEGSFCFIAAHSRHPELQLSVNVHVKGAAKVEPFEFQSPCSNEKVLLLQDSSTFKHMDLMKSIAKEEEKQMEDVLKYGELIGSCEKDLTEVHQRKAQIQQSISALQASTDPEIIDLDYSPTKEEIMQRIESRSHSAAAVVNHLSRVYSQLEAENHLVDDVIGVVALLGTVCNYKLSRILAEFLGEDQMLAVVCKSYEEATSGLEKYEENGKVDCNLALHALAARFGKPLCGRFLVICLEDIRPYTGEVQGDGPQRKLVLPDSTLHSGETATGFLGYAVNMVNLDVLHLNTKTLAGHGLRETLFYRLFGELQVYETREHMKRARGCIKHGAVSLDGGILRENGLISLGYGNPEICFPVSASGDEIYLSPQRMEFHKELVDKKAELQLILEEEKNLSAVHKKLKRKFEKKTIKYGKTLDEMALVKSL